MSALQNSGESKGRFADRMYLHRDRVTLIVVVAILVLIAILVGAIASYWLIPGFPAAAVVADDLTALLALGTLSLAYAAGFQALSTEWKRQGDLRPHLDLQAIKGSGGPVYWSQFKLGENESRFFLRLRNLGPGNAVSVHLTGHNWYVDSKMDSPELRELEAGGPPRSPLMTDPGPMASEVVKEPISLTANESFEVPYQVRIPPLRDFGAQIEQEATLYLQQVVFVATCEDVEGRNADELRVAFRLDALVPSGDPRGRALRNHTGIWRRLPASQAATIPVAQIVF